ncbi:MAG TPA: hypothetical protein VKP30_18590 [Polyangiaceae bacterium]|nr:hypothetical protein [Polyangiaceae bacterium]
MRDDEPRLEELFAATRRVERAPNASREELRHAVAKHLRTTGVLATSATLAKGASAAGTAIGGSGVKASSLVAGISAKLAVGIVATATAFGGLGYALHEKVSSSKDSSYLQSSPTARPPLSTTTAPNPQDGAETQLVFSTQTNHAVSAKVDGETNYIAPAGTDAETNHVAPASADGDAHRAASVSAGKETNRAASVSAGKETNHAASVSAGKETNHAASVSADTDVTGSTSVARSTNSRALSTESKGLSSPAKAQRESLAEELTLIRAAQSEISARHAGEALTLLQRYFRSFPRGALVPEAQVARIRALCLSGRQAQAESETLRFLRSNPNSPLAARVRGGCAAQ